MVGEDALQQNYAKKSLSLNWAAWQKEIPYFSAWGSHRSEELQGTILSSQDNIYIFNVKPPLRRPGTSITSSCSLLSVPLSPMNLVVLFSMQPDNVHRKEKA